MGYYDILTNNKNILRSSVEMIIDKYFYNYYDSFYQIDSFSDNLLITVKNDYGSIFFIRISKNDNTDVGIYVIVDNYLKEQNNIKKSFCSFITYEHRKKIINSL